MNDDYSLLNNVGHLIVLFQITTNISGTFEL